MNNLEQWQLQRIDLYTKSKALNFIKDYFNVKEGVKCIVGHVKDIYIKNRSPTYYRYENNKCRALTLPDRYSNDYTALGEFWCIHSLMYTFNSKVLDLMDTANHREVMATNIAGLNATIEIDSPEEPNTNKAKRTCFFDYINDFNITIDHIDKKLNNLGEDYNTMFSGNGIYIILEGYYESNLKEYVSNFINLIDKMKEDEGLGNSLKVHVDNKSAPWNDYFKIPFTFHEKRPRIAIPLPKGELDKEWIDRVTNSTNILNDYSIVDEIIKESNWKKLW